MDPTIYISTVNWSPEEMAGEKLAQMEKVAEQGFTGIFRDFTPMVISERVIHLYPSQEILGWSAPELISPLRNIAEAARSLALYGHSPD